MIPGPEAVVATLLGVAGAGWWDDDGTRDAAVELYRLIDEEPEVLAAALVAEVRRGRADEVAGLLEDAVHRDGVAVVQAASSLDPVVARRWAARLLDLEECVDALGTAGAVAVLQDEFAGTGPRSEEWAQEARRELWLQEPSRIWAFIRAADDRPVAARTEDPDLRSWLLAGAPDVLFRVNPPRTEPTPRERALLRAHVDAFVAQVLDALAAGEDPAPWIRSVSRRLHECVPSCCRPPRFSVAVSELGWFPA